MPKRSSSETKTSQPKIDPRNKLNDLPAAVWIPETISVWTQRGLGNEHVDARIERLHPAPFSFTDVSRLVNFFTKKGAIVLDPFVGVGSTLKACALTERNGVGFELNSKYSALARQRLKQEVPLDLAEKTTQKILTGDATDLIKKQKTHSVDFIVTSPPYWNILHKEDHKAKNERKDQSLDTRYSDNPKDLGNISSYDNFLSLLVSILSDCSRVLKPGKYMAVVVSDFRHKSRFVMFHADLAKALEPCGFSLRGIKVLFQRHKKIFPYGYPYAYVPNIHHQYILIFQNTKSE